MEQAASGKSTPGASGQPGDVLLVLAGHDTNLSNLSGMLGLSWRLPGYQPDDTPPGGALIFSLWRDPGTGQYSVKLRYLAQTLDQMRNAKPLSVAAPPASQDVPLPGCYVTGCPWETARRILGECNRSAVCRHRSPRIHARIESIDKNWPGEEVPR